MMNFTILFSFFINIIKTAFVNQNVLKMLVLFAVFIILKSATSSTISCNTTSKFFFTANSKTPFTTLLVKGLN